MINWVLWQCLLFLCVLFYQTSYPFAWAYIYFVFISFSVYYSISLIIFCLLYQSCLIILVHFFCPLIVVFFKNMCLSGLLWCFNIFRFVGGPEGRWACHCVVQGCPGPRPLILVCGASPQPHHSEYLHHICLHIYHLHNFSLHHHHQFCLPLLTSSWRECCAPLT